MDLAPVSLSFAGEFTMNFFILIYNSLIWGLLVAVLVTNNLWLDMRIKVGLIIPAVLIISVLAGVLTKSKLIRTPEFTLANVVFCFLITFLLLGAQRLVVLPASIIRETINLTFISFSEINWGLSITLILGLLLIWIRRPRSNKSSE